MQQFLPRYQQALHLDYILNNSLIKMMSSKHSITIATDILFPETFKLFRFICHTYAIIFGTTVTQLPIHLSAQEK